MDNAEGEDASPYQMVGPYGNLWTFHDLDKFSTEYPVWFSEFYDLIYSEEDSTDFSDSPYDDDYASYYYGNDEDDYYYEDQDDFVMCTMQYIDCSERGGYDLSDPCMHTCNDGESNYNEPITVDMDEKSLYEED
jgi:hypothetical protein